jgi:hypothetical protein
VRLLRSASAFLLTAHAVGMAEMAYIGGMAAVAVLAALVATVLGLTGDGPSTERPGRDRAATYRIVSLWSLYALYVMSAVLMASSGDRSLAAVLVGILMVAQLIFLAWPAIGPRAAPLLVNGLVLCALAAATGGHLPLFAVGGFAPLAAALIVIDHHHLRRARPKEALLPAAGHAGLAALLVWPGLPWLPRATVAQGGDPTVLPEPSFGDLVEGTVELLFWAGLGLVLVVLARWLLDRLRGPEEELLPDELEPVAEAGPSRSLGSALPPLALDLSGARGRVVRIFEDFLRAARKLGFDRRPNWTAAEFARRLPIPANRLARVFGRARYSDEDLSERDADRAAADAQAVLERLRDA